MPGKIAKSGFVGTCKKMKWIKSYVFQGRRCVHLEALKLLYWGAHGTHTEVLSFCLTSVWANTNMFRFQFAFNPKHQKRTRVPSKPALRISNRIASCYLESGGSHAITQMQRRTDQNVVRCATKSKGISCKSGLNWAYCYFDDGISETGQNWDEFNWKSTHAHTHA